LHAHTHTGFAYNLTEFISEASKCVSMFISWQQEVPLGPEWRVAGLAARDTEGENWHSSLGQNHTVWALGSGVLVDLHLCGGRGASAFAAEPPPTQPADGNPLLARTTLSVGSGLRLRRRRRSASAESSHWAASPNDGLLHHAAGWMRRSARWWRADSDGSTRRLRLLKLGRDGTSTSPGRARTGSSGGGEASSS